MTKPPKHIVRGYCVRAGGESGIFKTDFRPTDFDPADLCSQLIEEYGTKYDRILVSVS